MIKKGDTIPGIFSILVGAFALIYNYAHPKMAVFATPEKGGVGPGFFPFICGIALVVFGVLLVIRGIRQNGTVDYFQMTPERKQNMKMVIMLVSLIVVMLAAWKISEIFYLVLPFYCFGINKLVLKQSTKFSIFFTVVMTLFIYALFTMAFTVRFKP